MTNTWPSLARLRGGRPRELIYSSDLLLQCCEGAWCFSFLVDVGNDGWERYYCVGDGAFRGRPRPKTYSRRVRSSSPNTQATHSTLAHALTPGTRINQIVGCGSTLALLQMVRALMQVRRCHAPPATSVESQ
jgi:hypothetical protein